MSPKNSVSQTNKASDGGHSLRRCREPPHKSDKTKKKKLKLNESEASKSLYICHFEYHPGERVSYVVRTIKLSDLLSSDSVDGLQLHQVAYKPGHGDEEELPSCVGCGLLGSQIVFAAGLTPASRLFATFPNRVWHRDMYVYETDLNKQPNPVIRKMDAKLVQAKFIPLMEEVRGKLYALTNEPVSGDPSFEVFDPEMGTWSALPQPPFYQRMGRYNCGGTLSYAVTGTRMFVSRSRCPVFCFDVAHPRREWRLVDSMCQGGPFPFFQRALVLDLPGDNNKKLMFGYDNGRWHLVVYIMFLDKNREYLTQVADLKLPMWPDEFEFAKRCFLLHIGGQKACLVAPSMCPREDLIPKQNEVGSHKTKGVAMPFQFEVDTSKMDKDAKNCLTLRFMPTRIFEFYTHPSTLPAPRADGCFVL